MSEENPVENVTQEDHELAAVEKYARTNPQNLPAQFNGDPDKFLESYKELRKSYTKSQQELAQLKKGTPVATQEQPQTTPPSADPVQQLSIPKVEPSKEPTPQEWETYTNELRATGDLSQATRETIVKRHNIPTYVLDEYIKGLRAQSVQAANEAANLVGGHEKLRKMIDWATNNLTDEERTELNKQLATPAWKTVVMGLAARYQSSNPDPTSNEPKKPTPATVKGVSNSEVTPFMNRKDMTTHIRDPRYGRDAKYTQWVQDRIRISGAQRWKD